MPSNRMAVLETLRLHRLGGQEPGRWWTAQEIADDIGKIPGSVPPRRDSARWQPTARDVALELDSAQKDGLADAKLVDGTYRWHLTEKGREVMSRGPASA